MQSFSRPALLTALALALAPFPAFAAPVQVAVTDSAGNALPHAVVALVPAAGTSVPAPPPRTVVLDQRKEIFRPHVLVARPGDTLAVRNGDAKKHHSYSFTPMAKFSAEMGPNSPGPEVALPAVGEVAIGCNLHDGMLAYAVVVDAPVAGVTGPEGKVTLEAPAGAYTVRLWHPRGSRWDEPGKLEVAASGASASYSLVVEPKSAEPGAYDDPEQGFPLP